jgi:hypothetical protein
MTTLTIPSYASRLLQTVEEEVAAKTVQESLRLSLGTVRNLCENTANMRRVLVGVLAEGVEARSLLRDSGPLLASIDEQITKVQKLVERLSLLEDDASKSLAMELCLLQQAYQSFRDLLAEALSRASAAPRVVDWERVQAAEEAHARRETKPFSPK